MKYSILTLVTLAALLSAQGAFAQATPPDPNSIVTPSGKIIPLPGEAGKHAPDVVGK